MDSRSFYHPNLNGPQSERLLKERGENGSFLIRPSRSDPGHYVLSVINRDKVTHIKIQNEGDYYSLFGGKVFARIVDLVNYCIQNPDHLKEKNGDGPRLIRPIYSENPTSMRYFHGILEGKMAEELLRNKNVRNGTYLLRWSNSRPGDIVLSWKTEETVKQAMIIRENGGFRIGEGQTYSTLDNLIKDIPQIEQPMNITSFRASDVKRRITELDTESTNQRTGKSGFGEEFDALQHLEFTLTYERSEGNKDHNKPKNRYKNILPYDYTRVILRDKQGESSDYINANYITMKKVGDYMSTKFNKSFIATQGCLENTVQDFWRMAWQENCRIIVMTTKEVERGKKKCAKYWTDCSNDKTFDYGDGKLVIQFSKQNDHLHYILREFVIKLQNAEGHVTEKRQIYQFHFTRWPDHGVPNDPGPTLEYLQDIDLKQKSISNAGPVIVHCSAGIGRTGTFIVIDMILAIIEKFGVDVEIDIHKLVQIIRSQRPGMVQTEGQYRFIYLAVSSYMDTLLRRNAGNVYENAAYVPEKPEPAKRKTTMVAQVDKRKLYENINSVSKR